jgi:hypothetical protein
VVKGFKMVKPAIRRPCCKSSERKKPHPPRNERSSELLIEFLRRNDKDKPRALLFTSLCRIQVDVPNVAAIHQKTSRPMGSAASHILARRRRRVTFGEQFC